METIEEQQQKKEEAIILRLQVLFLHLGNEEGIQGLLICEQDALSAVYAEDVGIPITETFGVRGIRILKGRVMEFF